MNYGFLALRKEKGKERIIFYIAVRIRVRRNWVRDMCTESVFGAYGSGYFFSSGGRVSALLLSVRLLMFLWLVGFVVGPFP